MKKVIKYTTICIIALAFLAYFAFKISPWPSVLVIRSAFNKDGVKANKKLEKFVPVGVIAFLN